MVSADMPPGRAASMRSRPIPIGDDHLGFKHDVVIQKLHFILRSANSGHVLNLNSHQISFEMVIVHRQDAR